MGCFLCKMSYGFFFRKTFSKLSLSLAPFIFLLLHPSRYFLLLLLLFFFFHFSFRIISSNGSFSVLGAFSFAYNRYHPCVVLHLLIQVTFLLFFFQSSSLIESVKTLFKQIYRGQEHLRVQTNTPKTSRLGFLFFPFLLIPTYPISTICFFFSCDSLKH